MAATTGEARGAEGAGDGCEGTTDVERASAKALASCCSTEAVDSTCAPPNLALPSATTSAAGVGSSYWIAKVT